MEIREKALRRVNSYSGVIVEVTMDQVELLDGSRTFREVVHHPGGVAVLPVDSEGYAWCVRQFRYPFGQELLEVPAGKLERGEEPFPAAQRELGEETGLTAARWLDLGEIYASPGYCTEVLHLYLALELERGDSHPDAGEFLSVVRMPLEELHGKVLSGEITDGKTVVAVLKTMEYLRNA